jgi:hypothetical protein
LKLNYSILKVQPLATLDSSDLWQQLNLSKQLTANWYNFSVSFWSLRFNFSYPELTLP